MVSTGLSWATVADRVGTRSEKQCRTKWLNYLNWKVAGGTDWTREDDINLICRLVDSFIHLINYFYSGNVNALSNYFVFVTFFHTSCNCGKNIFFNNKSDGGYI